MLKSMSVRMATKDDQHLPAFDYTKLTAINTCPRWGLIRYDQHKRMPGESRALPLEVGGACHEAYSAIRMFQALEQANGLSDLTETRAIFDRVASHMAYLLDKGEDHKLDPTTPRTRELLNIFNSSEDARQRVQAMANYALNTSGFYDDPSDKRRTLSNMEQSIIAYIDRLDLGRIVPIVNDKVIGIEVPFDLVVTLTSDELLAQGPEGDIYAWYEFRYIGRMDGLMVDTNDGSINVDENKTASRLDTVWHESFVMSHQVTGYCVAASEILEKPVRNCRVLGMMIPLPKSYDLGGIADNPVTRDEGRISEWAKWLFDTIEVWAKHKDDPLNAPEYTHSCSRYFRSCSFLPLCAVTGEERQRSYEQMVHDQWSPLDKEKVDG